MPPANGFNPFGIFIDDAISCKKQPAMGRPHTHHFVATEMCRIRSPNGPKKTAEALPVKILK